MRNFGQGATEYLVLLAVVLIVALVSVALLGFFPGMASDAQITQSQMYWQSASPVAIVESAAGVTASADITYPYLLLENRGQYPIRITAIIGGDGAKTTQIYNTCEVVGTNLNISDFFYLAPGEKKYIGRSGSLYGLPCSRYIQTGSASSGRVIGGASSVCQNSSSSPGFLDYKTFGFEYVAYIDGQQITKTQIGRDLVIKCREPA